MRVLAWLTDTTGLEPGSLWLHAVSDLVIMLAYFSIPLAMIHFLQRQPNLPHKGIVLLFTAFVIACGATHGVSILTLWVPAYHFEGTVKAVTACLSITTAVVLWPLVPRLLAMPTSTSLEALNNTLTKTVAELSTSQQQLLLVQGNLRHDNEELELRVAERTAELVRSNATIARNEARFRGVVEAAPNAMVMINSAGQIAMVNTQAERVFGYDRADMLGQPLEMLVPARFRGRHPGLRAAFFADPRSRPMGAGHDLYGLKRDGREFPVEIGLNPIETDEGVMVLSAIVDITMRTRLEERFRRVVEAAPNAMVMIDATGQIRLVNTQAERVFGYARSELLGQAVEMLLPSRFRRKHPGLRTAFVADPRSRPMGAGRDLYGLKKDGSEFPVEIGLNPIETEEGPMVLSAVVDISNRVQLEAQLRQAQKMEAVGRLTAGVAHDFNNLLQAMMGGLELLKDRIGTDQTSDELLTMSIEAVQRGARLTHHLLAFSRIQVLRPSAIDVASLLRQTVAMLERTLGPSIVIHVHEDDSGLHAFADPAQVEACILNLAINARDAMQHGGVLTIRANRTQVDQTLASETLPPGEYVVLAVQDTGGGIAEDILDKVFEPFFTTKDVGDGSGLGLPMVLGFARQSGGDARITSTLGKGTLVEVFLPRGDGGKAEPPAATEKVRRGGAGHILLVDDAPDVLVTLGAFLEGAGFQVTKVRCADDALRIVAGPQELHAIVTDYAMPGMSGAELMLQVSQIRPGLPGLVVTGYPGIEGLSELPDRVQVLRKPFPRAELLHRMRILLETRGQTTAQPPL